MRAFVPALLLIALVGCSGGNGETASAGGGGTTGKTDPPKPAEPAPLTGNVMTTKNGKLSFVAPEGWTKIDGNDKVFNDATAKLDPAAKQQLITGAMAMELMAMDFKSPNTGFASNMNIVDSGPGQPASDAELEAGFKQIESQFAGAKMEHKIVKLPIGSALNYWGSIAMGGQAYDILGYALSGGGRVYVFTFSSGKGKIESIRSMADATMQTVRVN